MKQRMESQEQFILNRIIEAIKNLKEKQKENGGYNSVIEFAVSELVREEMRRIAQVSELADEDERLLSKAIRTTEEKMLNKLRRENIPFDVKNYLENVEKKLKFPATEISDLKKRLDESKERGRIAEKTSLTTQSGVPFEIIELGLRDSIDGLLARPLVETYEIDLEKIRERCEGENDSFPLEAKLEDLVFVIDDDGTIFVSIENLPKKLIDDANEKLRQLANRIYQVDSYA